MRLRFTFAALVLGFSCELVASEASHELAVGGRVDLNVKASMLTFSLPYPGLNHLPDCLSFIAQSGAPQLNLAKLAALIAVEDGSGILFQGSDRVLHLLPAQLSGKPPRSLVYVFKDVGTYSTGLRIRSVDGQPLRQVVQRVLKIKSNHPAAVEFTRTSRCS